MKASIHVVTRGQQMRRYIASGYLKEKLLEDLFNFNFSWIDIRSLNFTSPSSMTPEESSENDFQTLLPTCRICQMNSEECPELPLLRPCLCSGSLAYVHVKCLNEWRATSPSAQTTCSICKFRYRTKRSSRKFIELLSNSNVIVASSVIVILLCIVITGTVIQLTSSYLFPAFDLAKRAADFVAVHRWWHSCYYIIWGLRTPEGNSLDTYIENALQFGYRLICCPLVTTCMDAFMNGYLFVSYSAIIITIIMKLHRRRVMGENENPDQNQIFVIISMVATLYSQPHVK